MATLTKDDVWKVIQMGLATMVVPLAGWVWNMNVEVAELKNDLGDAEVVIERLVKKKDQYETKEIELASQIIGIEKDIEYMKEGQAKMQNDLTMIKKTLLDPDAGTIARVNQNTNFRKSAQQTLWSIWIALIGIIGKMIFWN